LPGATAPAYHRIVAALDAVVVPSVLPWDLLGLQLCLMESVAAQRTDPVLLVYAIPGRVVSIGRYHLYSGTEHRNDVMAMRRLTGGRATGAGEGWIGLALILPHRGALLPARDANLKPDQVMNRYARGLLAGLRKLGLECFYPGRDAITRERREIAMCAFESDPSGAVLFEAMLAVSRGMEDLSHDLDRLDPNGEITSAVHGPESCSTLMREVADDIGFAQISDAVVEGYAQTFGEARRRDLTSDETARAARGGKELQSIHWLRRLADRSEYGRSGRIAAQLGQITASIGVSRDDRIERLMLSGDFLANSSGIAELEASVEGLSHDLIAVSNAVTRTFADGRNFILGAGDLSNLVKLIASAQ
jgi:lipoate-protein ligase A